MACLRCCCAPSLFGFYKMVCCLCPWCRKEPDWFHARLAKQATAQTLSWSCAEATTASASLACHTHQSKSTRRGGACTWLSQPGDEAMVQTAATPAEYAPVGRCQQPGSRCGYIQIGVVAEHSPGPRISCRLPYLVALQADSASGQPTFPHHPGPTCRGG